MTVTFARLFFVDCKRRFAKMVSFHMLSIARAGLSVSQQITFDIG